MLVIIQILFDLAVHEIHLVNLNSVMNGWVNTSNPVKSFSLWITTGPILPKKKGGSASGVTHSTLPSWLALEMSVWIVLPHAIMSHLPKIQPNIQVNIVSLLYKNALGSSRISGWVVFFLVLCMGIAWAVFFHNRPVRTCWHNSMLALDAKTWRVIVLHWS